MCGSVPFQQGKVQKRVFFHILLEFPNGLLWTNVDSRMRQKESTYINIIPLSLLDSKSSRQRIKNPLFIWNWSKEKAVRLLEELEMSMFQYVTVFTITQPARYENEWLFLLLGTYFLILKLTFKHRVWLIAIRVVQSIQALLGMIAFLYNKRKRRGRMSSSLHTR